MITWQKEDRNLYSDSSQRLWVENMIFKDKPDILTHSFARMSNFIYL